MVQGQKKQKCITGKSCGTYCIPKKYTCRDKSDRRKSSQIAVRQPRKQKDGIDLSFPVLAIAGGGLGGVAVAAGATLLAKQGYAVAKQQYRENLDRNATRIPELAKSVKAPRIPRDKDTMIFEVGGFGTPDAYSESVHLNNQLKGLGIDKGVHHEPFEYKDFNVYSGIDPKKPKIKDVQKAVDEARRLFVETVFKKKENPAAIRLASHVMAYQDQNPHVKNTAVVSHSGGGYIATEAENLLRRNNRDIKVLAIGTPDMGILEDSPNIKTAISSNDEIIRSTTKKGINQVSFDNVKSHGIEDYFEDEDFRAFVKDYLTFKKRTDSVRLDKQKCVTGQPCGSICIPKKYTCHKEKAPSKASSPKQKKLSSSSPGSGSSSDALINGALAAVAIAAGSAAVSAGAYHGIRANYRAQYGKSAKEAARRSKEIDWNTLPDYKGKEGGYLLMPGYSAALGDKIAARTEDIMKEQVGGFVPETTHPLHLISNKKFNIGEGLPDVGKDLDIETKDLQLKDITVIGNAHLKDKEFKQITKNVATSLTKPVLMTGRNEQAIDSAASLMAMRDKYMAQNDGKEPQLRAVGVSAGGIYGADTDMILKKAGMKVDMMFFGSPYLGIADPKPDNIVRLFSSNDALVGKLSGGNAAYFQHITNHTGYHHDPKVKELIEHFTENGAKATRDKFYPQYPYKKIPKTKPDHRDSQVTITHLDSRGKPNCKVGKPCKTQQGATVCIPKSYTCHKEKKPGKTSLPKQKRLSSPNSKSNSQALVNGALATAAVVAGSAAVSVGAYHGIRANYRAQYGKSAKEAVRRSKEVDWNTLPDYKGKEGGYLLMPGYSAALGDKIAARAEDIMKEEVTEFVPQKTHPSHLVNNKKFNIGEGLPDIGKDFNIETENLRLKDIAEIGKTHLKGKEFTQIAKNIATSLTKPVVMTGRNEQAIDTAASLLAMRDKFMSQNDGKEPQFRAIGVSAGGIYGADTDMVLKKAGVKVDMLFFGSPYLGIADPKPDNIVRVFSSNDFLVGKLSGGDAAYFQHVTDHTGYHHDPKVRELIEYFTENGAKATRDKFYPQYSYKKKPLGASIHKDSQNAIAKFDSKGKPNCKIGKPCKTQQGTTVCIPKSYTCSSDRRKESPPKRRQISLSSPQGQPGGGDTKPKEEQPPETSPPNQSNNGGVDSEYKIDPKTGAEYTIRDLKRIAREKSIGSYSELDKDALRARIIAHDKAPPKEQLEYKSKLIQRGVTKAAINKAFSGRGDESKAAKKAALEAREFWKNLETIAVFAGTKPVAWGALAIGAYAAGMGLKSYETAKDSYRANFKVQSKEAFDKALTLGSSRGKLTRPGFKKNITLVVSNSEEESQGMIDALDEASEKSGGEDADKWLSSKSQHFVKFANKEGSFKETGNPVVDGISNIKNYARNVKRGKDQDAIDLAAQIYGYAIQTGTGTAQRKASQRVERMEQSVSRSEDRINDWISRMNDKGTSPDEKEKIRARIEKEREKRRQTVQSLRTEKARKGRMEDKKPIREFLNQDKKINIIADRNSHSVKSALEIVAKIDPPKGAGFPSGKDVLTQTNVTMLGTPHFGFTEKRAAQQRTIISAQDPVAILPVFGDGGRQQWISSTKGTNAIAYLQDENVREALRETFGYYDDSTIELLRKGNTVGRRNERFTTDSVCPPRKHWVADKRVKSGGYCRSGGYEQKKIRNNLGRGPVAGTIGGLGADIERAVIKTRRLVGKAGKQKYMTRKEKAKDEAKFQAQQMGILLGKGTVSKAFRNFDNAMLEMKEKNSNIGDKIKSTIDAIVEAIASSVGIKPKKDKKEQQQRRQ